MLQRIQSIYLFLATITIIALFFVPIMKTTTLNESPIAYELPNHEFSIYASGRFLNNPESAIMPDSGPFMEAVPVVKVKAINSYHVLFMVIIIAGLMITIFLYKNRPLQIRLCRALLLLTSILVALIFTELSKDLYNPGLLSNSWQAGAFIPALTVLFIILATRAIKKDEELVRSADRIR